MIVDAIMKTPLIKMRNSTSANHSTDALAVEDLGDNIIKRLEPPEASQGRRLRNRTLREVKDEPPSSSKERKGNGIPKSERPMKRRTKKGEASDSIVAPARRKEPVDMSQVNISTCSSATSAVGRQRKLRKSTARAQVAIKDGPSSGSKEKKRKNLNATKTKKPRTMRGNQAVSTKKIPFVSYEKQAYVLRRKLYVGFVPKKANETTSER